MTYRKQGRTLIAAILWLFALAAGAQLRPGTTRLDALPDGSCGNATAVAAVLIALSLVRPDRMRFFLRLDRWSRRHDPQEQGELR